MQKHIVRFLGRITSLLKSQRGITGLETAIVLIAFVVVSSVFAFATLSAGLFSSDKAKDTIHAGIAETRASMQLKGSVIATADSASTTGAVTNVSFQVALAAGGATIDLTPGQTIIKYTDTVQSKLFDATTGFTVTSVGGADSDNLLERNESLQIELINLETGFHDTDNNTLKSKLGTNTTFTLEVVPPQGPILFIERSTPINFDLTTNLD